MASRDREFIERSLRWGIVALVAVGGVLLLLWALKGVLTSVAAAFVVAYLLDPLIDRFEARGVSRRLAVLLLLLATGAAWGVALVYLVPAMQREVTLLAQRLPAYLERNVAGLLPELERRLGIEIPGTVEELFGQLEAAGFQGPIDALQRAFEGALTGLTGTLTALVALVLVPVVAYYFLIDFDELKRKPLVLVPPRHRLWVVDKARTVDGIVSRFLRGQLIICGILAVLYAVGFYWIGIQLAFVIALFAGIAALVPYLGNLVALTTACAMSVLQFGFDVHLALVVGWYAVVQNLEGWFLTPRIVGGSLGLHPVTVILALLIGGDLLGFLGVLIAVPAAAVGRVFLDELLERYRASAFYSSSNT